MSTAHALPPQDNFFAPPSLRSNSGWLLAAVLGHAIPIALFLYHYNSPAVLQQTMEVSILPMAPPSVAPPAAAHKAQPVQKKSITKPIEQSPLVKPSETSISQPQAASAAGQSNSNQAASGSDKPSQDLPITSANNAAYLNNPKPPYPAMSRRLNEQGTVMLEVRVLANGNVEKVEIAKSSGFARLDESARETVLKWRFEPARRGGEAIAQTIKTPISFVLEK